MGVVMKFILFLQLVLASNILLGQNINFHQNKNSAGKASLTSDAYYSNFVLGTANFSPELRLPVQIFYDSSVKEEGIVGLGWKIPQLESSAVPEKGGALWTAPWGEKIYFYSRKNTSRDILNLFNEKSAKMPTFRHMPIGLQTGAPTAVHGRFTGAGTCAGGNSSMSTRNFGR